MKPPRGYGTFTAEIERVSTAGNGIVTVQGKELNIGPVIKDSVGKEIEGTRIAKRFAICHDESIRASHYEPRFKDLVDPSKWSAAVYQTRLTAPERYGTFTAEIDRVSNSGKGVVNINGTELVIGPVIKDSVGTKVEATRVTEDFAICYDDHVTVSDYGAKIGSGPSGWSFVYQIGTDPPEEAISFTTAIARISNSGNGIVNVGGKEINIGPIEDESVGKEIKATMVSLSEGGFAVCHDESIWVDDYGVKFEKSAPVSWRQGKDAPKGILKAPPEWVHEAVVVDSDPEEEALEETEDHPSPEATYQSSSRTPSQTGSESVSEEEKSSIKELRRKAEEDAVEKVSYTVTTSSQTTQEYTRSSAVRKYVLARANGQCEGCEEPAPFVNKSGEPYLHAHHIHELSEGGADTPDTVVALCPNCHYRIHHGKNGEEYNQELLEIVQNSES